MSLESVHLRKLLQMFFLPANKLTTSLRADIRLEIKKAQGEAGDGGDFHGPFWTDAKRHVSGDSDLLSQMTIRIRSNKRRERLYPALVRGFLSWWEERRRWRNEPFKLITQSVKARFRIQELDAIVKIENVLAFEIDDESKRIIYPYFSEEPELTEDGARIGLWLLCEALPTYNPQEFRILDILRSKSFGLIDVPFQGDERDVFVQKYRTILTQWKNLRDEYD
jgi:hypothetical protein